MADAHTHVIAVTEVAAHNVTLAAMTVERFVFPDNVSTVEILSDGADDIYLTLDGTPPTIGGPMTYRIQAVMGQTIVNPTASGPTTIAMISVGTPNVSVGRTNA